VRPDLKAAIAEARDALTHPLGDMASIHVNDLRLILAALDEQEWRPIETLGLPDYNGFDAWLKTNRRWANCWRLLGRIWAYDSYGEHIDITDLVAFWRPLPAPPVEVKGP
jgi:hypothetical protein